MTKYLLLILLVFAVWTLWRNSRKSPNLPGGSARAPERAPERMVQCARCSVNQPVSESILAHGHYYCSVTHLRETHPNAS